MELRHKVMVVTGASSGLGRRFALDFARAGAVVIGVARRADLLASLAQEMQVWSPGSSTLTVDVADTDAFVAALDGIEREHGRIDILVNNAAIDEPGTAETLAPYRRLMETNFFAVVAGTLAVLPGMRARHSGVVVNVSSDSGRAPGPLDAAYAPSKAAVSAFTESVAFQAEADGVALHLLYPGWVPTAMGNGAVAAGMPMPPRMVTRTEEQVSRLLLERLGGPKLDIDATLVARIAPAARAIVPSLYRRGVRRALG